MLAPLGMLAADIWESPLTLNPAARLVQERGAAAPALALWQRSLWQTLRSTRTWRRGGQLATLAIESRLCTIYSGLWI
jgi:hypothetical protein